MRAGVVAFVRSELPQQMNRPTRVAFRQRERSRKVILASQVDRLNNMSRRTKRTTPIMGSIPARGVFP